MFTLEKFQSPAAKNLMILGGVTAATSVAFTFLPKGLAVVVLTAGAAVITAQALDQNAQKNKLIAE